MIDSYFNLPEDSQALVSKISGLSGVYRVKVSQAKRFSRESQNWYRANCRLLASEIGMDEIELHIELKRRCGFSRDIRIAGEKRQITISESELSHDEHVALCAELERVAIFQGVTLMNKI